MLPTSSNARRQAWTKYISRRLCRSISSISHLTESETRLFFEHLDARKCSRRVQQETPEPRFLQPHIYQPRSSKWIALQTGPQGTLERGGILKAISWNLCSSGPDPAARASAALDHLQTLFGSIPHHQVVMLQEVCLESLRAMLESPWVQRSFILSNVLPPESVYTDIPAEYFILRRLEWEAKPHFTLMMVSRDLGIMDCFRVPFVTVRGRDALVVDVPVHDQGERNGAAKSIRLCTTHLESLYTGKAWRPGQLALISNLLKGIPVTKSQPIAGLVGGDMNAFDSLEHEFHRAIDVDLKDVWEDVPAPAVPIRKPHQKDPSYGRAKGNTHGYQSRGDSHPKRLDKFFYTGSIETMTPSKIQDVVGRLGRLGIHLRTDVEAWECARTIETFLVRGKFVRKVQKKHYSDQLVKRLQERGHVFGSPLVWKKFSTWVSDHFGIAVRVKVL